MTFNWNFGNGLFSNAKDTIVTFAANAIKDTTYTINLKAYSEHNCVDSMVQSVLIYPKPLASFEAQYNGSCSPLNVQFINKSDPYDTSTIADMLFTWDLGGGVSTSRQDTSLVLSLNSASDSFYVFTLFGSSEHQCKDTFTDSVLVTTTPSTAFSIDTTSGCGPLLVNVKHNDSKADSIFWNIGNGYFSGSGDTAFTFEAAQFNDTTYKVSLTTKTKYNCGNDTSFAAVTLWPKPLVFFEPQYSGSCSPVALSLENKSDPYDTSTISDMNFNWYLGGGVTTSTQDTSLVLNLTTAKDSFYVFTLRGESEHQCKDTFTDSVLVTATPEAIFTIDTTTGCGPLRVNLQNNDWRADSLFWSTGNGYFFRKIRHNIYFRVYFFNRHYLHCFAYNKNQVQLW